MIFFFPPLLSFHLKNGAFVARLNWMADTSTNGLNQSLGMMVNYKYDPEMIEKRSYAYKQNSSFDISSDVTVLI